MFVAFFSRTILRKVEEIGPTLVLVPPIAPHDGCLVCNLDTSELLLLVLLRTDPLPFISSEFRFKPMLDRAFKGCGRVLELSTRELWVRSFGVACGPTLRSFLTAPGAAGVRVMTAGADTTDFRYGDTYGGFFVPRTALTGSAAAGVAGLRAGLILPVLIGTLLGLERGVLGWVGGRAVTICGSCAEMLGIFCSRDFLR